MVSGAEASIPAETVPIEGRAAASAVDTADPAVANDDGSHPPLTGPEGDGGDTSGSSGCQDGKPKGLKAILSRFRGRSDDLQQTETLAAEVQCIRDAIADALEHQQSDENQGELARIANLLPNADILARYGRLKSLALCLAAFQGASAKAVFIAAVRSDCELTVLRSQRGMFRFVYRVSGTTPISATLSGLIFSAVAMIVVAFCFAGLGSRLAAMPALGQLNIPWPLFNAMLILSAVGAFVSVLSRLGQLQSNRGYDAFLVFATGFFKPWIGVAFGAFLFFVLHAHLINIAGLTDATSAGAGTDNDSVFCVLAFISGFSERLVSDFISRTGNSVLGPPPVASSPKADPPPH